MKDAAIEAPATEPSPPSAAAGLRPLRGVFLVMAAVLVFALGDVATKHLATRHDVALVLFGRYAVNLLLLVAIFGPRHGRGLVRTSRTGLVLARAVCLALASLTMALALRWMPVAETVAIIYLAPIAVMLLAVPLLGERVALAGWVGPAAAFAGVLLIVRPSSGLAPLGVTFALLNAGMVTAYHLLTRGLARTESTQAMLFHVAWVGTVAFGAALPWSEVRASLTSLDLGLLLWLGASATLGHFLFTAAYREAPASLLAPVNYMHLVWAAVLGWLAFGHVPDGLSLLGMVLVAAAGVATALGVRPATA